MYSPSRAPRRCNRRTSRAPPIFLGEVILGDDVADPDTSARPEHAGDLGQHRRLVGREVDHAVRDDDIDRLGGKRDLLDDRPSGSGRSRRPPPPRSAGRARASRRSCRARRRGRSARRASPRGSRRCRRPSRDRAPSRPRADRQPRSGCRSRARQARQRPAARRAARRRRAPRRTSRSRRRSPPVVRAARPCRSRSRRSRRSRPCGLGVAAAHFFAQLVTSRGHQQHTPFRSATAATRSNASSFIEK